MPFLNHPLQCGCPVCQNYLPYDLDRQQGEDWRAEYDFWVRIISDEVARRRFNEGFEPIDIELFEAKDSRGRWRLIGKTRICGRDFAATLIETRSQEGQKIFKLSIRALRR